MTCIKCGFRYKEVDWSAIHEGYKLAFSGKRSYAKNEPQPQTPINFTSDELEELLM